MRLIFVGQGYPRKLFNLEHFPIYGMFAKTLAYNSQNYAGTLGSGLPYIKCMGSFYVICFFSKSIMYVYKGHATTLCHTQFSHTQSYVSRWLSLDKSNCTGKVD